MRTRRALYWGVVAVITAITACVAAASARLSAQQTPPDISLGDSDLGGVATSANGPEAGV